MSLTELSVSSRTLTSVGRSDIFLELLSRVDQHQSHVNARELATFGARRCYGKLRKKCLGFGKVTPHFQY